MSATSATIETPPRETLRRAAREELVRALASDHGLKAPGLTLAQLVLIAVEHGLSTEAERSERIAEALKAAASEDETTI